MKRSLFPTALAVSALIAGCALQETEDGEAAGGRASARFHFRAVSESQAAAKITASTPSLSLLDAAGLRFTVEEARAHIGRIKLEAEDDSCESRPEETDDDTSRPDGDPGEDDSTDTAGGSGDCGESELEMRGSFVVDLLAGASTPAISPLAVPAANYKKLKIRLEPARSGNVQDGDPLKGNTLVVKGTYVLAGLSPRPFTLALRFDEDLELEDEDGLKMDPDRVEDILVSLKVDNWLSGLRVQDCLDKAEIAAELSTGVLTISEDSKIGSCLDAEGIIKENIKRSFEVEDDHDDHDDHDGDDDGRDSI
jgi:hypothetical protein